MKKILVTGSSGMVGTRLCQRLLANGYDIVGLDRRQNTWDPAINAKTIITDLREKVPENVPYESIDLIIHLAANARVYDLIRDPQLANDNIQILFNVLEFARQKEVSRVIFASSREVYGDSGKEINAEDDLKLAHCESPYTASKIAGEAMIHAYHRSFNLDFIIFRFSNIYGMYDMSNRVIPLFISRCARNQDIHVYGKDKCLDFIHIDDVVNGLLLGIEKYEEVKNHTYNIASGEGLSVANLAYLIQKITNSTNNIHIRDNRQGEVMYCVADITQSKQKLGFSPSMQPTEGVTQTIVWYLSSGFVIEDTSE